MVFTVNTKNDKVPKSMAAWCDQVHNSEGKQMRNEINLTDDQIEELFERAFYIGVSIENIDFTRDTIENFVDGLKSFESWNKPVIGECDGFKTLDVMNVKVAKGKPKQDIHVIDFGTVRAISQL